MDAEKEDQVLTIRLLVLLIDIFKGDPDIDHKTFCRELQNSMKEDIHDQQDAHEFLVIFLEKITKITA